MTASWHLPARILAARPDLHVKAPHVIEVAMRYHPGPTRLVVQAGAHLGRWPAALAQLFAWVLAFEPVLANWTCCLDAITAPNVLVVHGCLGRVPGDVVHVADVAKAYSGSAYVTTKPQAFASPVYTIDQWAATLPLPIDALFLDVEGYEGEVLAGAVQTLVARKPLVVVEENKCGARFGLAPGDLGRWLAGYGYIEAARYDRDLIFTARR